MAEEIDDLLNELNLTETDQYSTYFMSPRSTQGMWVFWTEGTGHSGPQTDSFRKKIKSALCDLCFSHCDVGSKILVQFWAPLDKEIGGDRFVLATSNQPFALGRIDEGLCKYRNHCMSFEIIVDDEVTQDDLGLPGRVFQNKYPESTPDVRYYSPREYPQRDVAESCDIRRSLAVPVFEPSGQGCVGVLELVDANIGVPFPPDLYHLAQNVLKDVALKSCCQLRAFRNDRLGFTPYRKDYISKRRKINVNHVTTLINTPLQDDIVTIKAKFRDNILKFLLSTSSGISELLENMSMRVPLEDGTYRIKYQNSDWDWVLIDCDKDLHDCLGNSRLQLLPQIRMLIDEPEYEPVTYQTP